MLQVYFGLGFVLLDCWLQNIFLCPSELGGNLLYHLVSAGFLDHKDGQRICRELGPLYCALCLKSHSSLIVEGQKWMSSCRCKLISILLLHDMMRRLMLGQVFCLSGQFLPVWDSSFANYRSFSWKWYSSCIFLSIFCFDFDYLVCLSCEKKLLIASHVL